MNNRYYPAFLDFKKAGENKFFVVNRNDIKTHITSAFEGNLLKILAGCKTRDEHIESIMESAEYSIEKAVILNFMENWIKTGFLRNEKLLLQDSCTNKKKNNQKVISGCITSNRPEMLKLWLQSRLKTADYIEKKTPIIICDDTKIRDLKKRNKSILGDYSKDYPGNIYYLDKDKKIALSKKINNLLPVDVSEDLINFSLSINHTFPVKNTTGSNRNALLLSSAGYNLYTSDDDLEYKFLSQKTENENYYFPDEKILSPIFFPEMNSLSNSGRILEKINLIDQFEKSIGSNIFTLINKNHSDLFQNITSQTAMLQEKNLLKIRTVSAGYYGGRWYQDPYLPLTQRNEEMEEYYNNYSKYEQIKNIGLNIMAAEKKILVVGDSLMGGTLCIDNQNILPPCFPLGSRNDTCFSILLNSCLEPCLSLHLPSALYHNPIEKPPFAPEVFENTALYIGEYSILILEKMLSSFLHPGGIERLRELGLRLQEFGNLKITEFEEQLKLMQLGFLTKSMTQISYLLDIYHGEPSWWADDMKKYYKLLEQEALSAESVVPKELRTYGTKEESLTVFKDYIFKCGEMLEYWPEIWEAARTLNMEGRGLFNLNE